MDNEAAFQNLYRMIDGSAREFMKSAVLLTWLSIIQTILLSLIVWRLW